MYNAIVETLSVSVSNCPSAAVGGVGDSSLMNVRVMFYSVYCFLYCCIQIPQIPTKRTITSHLNSLNTNRMTTKYDVGEIQVLVWDRYTKVMP